jgi:transposase
VNTLSIREAAAKYDVPPSTISGWVAAGLVRCLEKPKRRGQPMLVLEADVAAAAACRVPGIGHWNTRRIRETLAAG